MERTFNLFGAEIKIAPITEGAVISRVSIIFANGRKQIFYLEPHKVEELLFYVNNYNTTSDDWLLVVSYFEGKKPWNRARARG